MSLKVSDNHCHVNPVRGLGPREVARRFRKEGGHVLVVVSLLTWSLELPPCELSSFEKLYRMTVDACRQVREEGVPSLCILGIHPAEIHQMILRGWSLDQILSFVDSCMKLVEKHVKNGEAHGIGEVGRPHWDVSEKELEIHNTVLARCLEHARDLDVPVHLHLERRGISTVNSVAEMVNRIGNRKYSVVLHHAEGKVVQEAYSRGLMPSVPVGKRQDLEEAIKQEPVYVVESDYLDDPNRPGAVIPPWSLVRKLRNYVNSGKITADYLRKLTFDNMRLVYGDLIPEP